MKEICKTEGSGVGFFNVGIIWEIMGSDCGPQDIEKQTEELGKILNEILEQLKSIRRYGINQTKTG